MLVILHLPELSFFQQSDSLASYSTITKTIKGKQLTHWYWIASPQRTDSDLARLRQASNIDWRICPQCNTSNLINRLIFQPKWWYSKNSMLSKNMSWKASKTILPFLLLNSCAIITVLILITSTGRFEMKIFFQNYRHKHLQRNQGFQIYLIPIRLQGTAVFYVIQGFPSYSHLVSVSFSDISYNFLDFVGIL